MLLRVGLLQSGQTSTDRYELRRPSSTHSYNEEASRRRHPRGLGWTAGGQESYTTVLDETDTGPVIYRKRGKAGRDIEGDLSPAVRALDELSAAARARGRGNYIALTAVCTPPQREDNQVLLQPKTHHLVERDVRPGLVRSPSPIG